jgi:hypothetical protein
MTFSDAEKYHFNSLMSDQVGRWLIDESSILGVHFQNWMPVALGIILVGILLAGRMKRSD